MAKKFWIKSAIKHPGALRDTTNMPEGKNIPSGILRSLAHKPGKTGKQARLAMTLRSFKKG